MTSAAIVIGLELLVFLAALIIVPPKRKPSSAWAWILLSLLAPVVGLLVFLIIGSPRLPRRRREKQQSMNERIEERARDVEPAVLAQGGPPWLASVARLNETVGAMPLLEGNRAHLLTTFDQQLATMIATVDKAKRYLHVEFYILSLDDSTRAFFAALEAAVARGVTVRVLFDHIGSLGYPDYFRTCRELDRIGVEWHRMLPLQPWRGRFQRPDLRNHRKLLVADGTVAYVGSLNMIDPSYNRRGNKKRGLQWLDLMTEVHGPVVHEIDALFVTDWYSETDELLRTSLEQSPAGERTGSLLCQIAPSGPAYEMENNLALFNTLIYYAQRRLNIISPYTVPDESMLAALRTAALRGVEVELFVCEVGDQPLALHAQHSYYRTLLEAGVRIHLYPQPTILHSKAMSVDEQVTVIGSSNMDIRSFQLDLELSLMSCDAAFTDELRALEDEYRAVSRELTLEEWGRRSGWHRFVDNLARLTSAVM